MQQSLSHCIISQTVHSFCDYYVGHVCLSVLFMQYYALNFLFASVLVKGFVIKHLIYRTL
jgi:hypothetical protein